MAVTDNVIFQDANAAREWLETLLWPEGPQCPHCGLIGAAYKMHNKSQRPGVYKCKGCDEQFTVTVGTAFERSHIPLNKWVMALQFMAASKKGVSAHQMHRMLGITYKSAWFMMHRIREALTDGLLVAKLGGENRVVEIDETYVGGKARNRKNHVPPKEAVVALVERDGRVRLRHVANVDGANLRPILKEEINKATYVMTDDSPVYPSITATFGGHGTVNHSIEEYVRGGFWHTNTVENYFSILKRGIIGTYHHVSEAHLHRYLAEFDFRYNQRARLGIDDAQRMAKAAKGIAGKRLTYRRTRRAEKTEDEIPF